MIVIITVMNHNTLNLYLVLYCIYLSIYIALLTAFQKHSRLQH